MKGLFSKNALTLSLMWGSILLVLLLQAFWLRSSYQDAGDDFRKEANFIFRTTLMSLQDSLVQRNIEQVPADSVFLSMKMAPPHAADSADLVHARLPQWTDSGHVAVMVSNALRSKAYEGPDSAGRELNVAFAFRKDQVTRYFLFRNNAELAKEDVSKAYAQALAEAGISLSFDILNIPLDSVIALRKERFAPPPPHKAGREGAFREMAVHDRMLLDRHERTPGMPSLRIMPAPIPSHEFYEQMGLREGEATLLEPVFLPTTGMISVRFSPESYRWLLLRKISPQLLFSLVMILFISISFYFMYRSLRMQQRLVMLKNDFVNNITHELKTPLATASVAVEALRDFKMLRKPERAAEYLEIAQQALNRLVLLADNILKAAALEGKGADLPMEKVDLEAVSRQVLDSLQLLFQKRQASVAFRAEGGDYVVEGGKAHLVNVFYNLLDNALKYSPAPPRIFVELKSMEQGVQVLVQDEGMGIAPEFHKKVFEKFFRVPNGNVHNIKGYGLGLSYVAGVVRSHGGHINLESLPGRGSTFTLYLPRVHEKN